MPIPVEGPLQPLRKVPLKRSGGPAQHRDAR